MDDFVLKEEPSYARMQLVRRVKALRAPTGEDARSQQIAAQISNLRRRAPQMLDTDIERELAQIERMQKAPPLQGAETAPTPEATKTVDQARAAELSEAAERDSPARNGTAETDWQHIEDKQRYRERYEDKQMYAAVRREIRKLKPGYAKVMRLCLEGDYTFEEIAEKSGLSKATAWRYYNEAVQTIAINVDPERLATIATAGYEPNGAQPADELPTEARLTEVPAAFENREAEAELDNDARAARNSGRFNPLFFLKWQWADTLRLRKVRQIAPPQQLNSSGADATPDDDKPKPITAKGGSEAPEVLEIRRRRLAKYGPYRGEEEE